MAQVGQRVVMRLREECTSTCRACRRVFQQPRLAERCPPPHDVGRSADVLQDPALAIQRGVTLIMLWCGVCPGWRLRRIALIIFPLIALAVGTRIGKKLQPSISACKKISPIEVSSPRKPHRTKIMQAFGREGSRRERFKQANRRCTS